jgi:hypothetical protein
MLPSVALEFNTAVERNIKLTRSILFDARALSRHRGWTLPLFRSTKPSTLQSEQKK